MIDDTWKRLRLRRHLPGRSEDRPSRRCDGTPGVWEQVIKTRPQKRIGYEIKTEIESESGPISKSWWPVQSSCASWPISPTSALAMYRGVSSHSICLIRLNPSPRLNWNAAQSYGIGNRIREQSRWVNKYWGAGAVEERDYAVMCSLFIFLRASGSLTSSQGGSSRWSATLQHDNLLWSKTTVRAWICLGAWSVNTLDDKRHITNNNN